MGRSEASRNRLLSRRTRQGVDQSRSLCQGAPSTHSQVFPIQGLKLYPENLREEKSEAVRQAGSEIFFFSEGSDNKYFMLCGYGVFFVWFFFKPLKCKIILSILAAQKQVSKQAPVYIKPGSSREQFSDVSPPTHTGSQFYSTHQIGIRGCKGCRWSTFQVTAGVIQGK